MVKLNLIRKVLIPTILAAGLFIAAPASAITTYHATEAQRDPGVAPFSGGHALWLPDNSPSHIPNGNSSRFLFVDHSGQMVVSDDKTTAHLTGIIRAEGDPASVWAVDVMFILGMNYSTFANGHTDPLGGIHDGQAKKELFSNQYVDNGGTIDPTTWYYYYMDEQNATLIGTADGNYEGVTLNLFQRPNGNDFGKYVFQLGEGANGKNLNLGFSGWLGYHPADLGLQDAYDQQEYFSGIGDINIDLEAIPEPVTATLTFMGLGALGLATRRRQSA